MHGFSTTGSVGGRPPGDPAATALHAPIQRGGVGPIAHDAEGGAAEVIGSGQRAPAAGRPPAFPTTDNVIAHASVVGAGGAPDTGCNPAGSALPVSAPRIALLAGLAEALLDEHQIDPSGRCRACGLPVAR
jgi:hypothetical protein